MPSDEDYEWQRKRMYVRNTWANIFSLLFRCVGWGLVLVGTLFFIAIWVQITVINPIMALTGRYENNWAIWVFWFIGVIAGYLFVWYWVARYRYRRQL